MCPVNRYPKKTHTPYLLRPNACPIRRLVRHAFSKKLLPNLKLKNLLKKIAKFACTVLGVDTSWEKGNEYYTIEIITSIFFLNGDHVI